MCTKHGLPQVDTVCNTDLKKNCFNTKPIPNAAHKQNVTSVITDGLLTGRTLYFVDNCEFVLSVKFLIYAL
jgi:hypothetical protein